MKRLLPEGIPSGSFCESIDFSVTICYNILSIGMSWIQYLHESTMCIKADYDKIVLGYTYKGEDLR